VINDGNDYDKYYDGDKYYGNPQRKTTATLREKVIVFINASPGIVFDPSVLPFHKQKMNFASPVAYVNPDESASDEEESSRLRDGANFRQIYSNLTPAPSNLTPAPSNLTPGAGAEAPKPTPTDLRAPKKKKAKRHQQAGSDTNVVEVKFSSLVDNADVFVGDAIECSNKECKAIFSVLSRALGRSEIAQADSKDAKDAKEAKDAKDAKDSKEHRLEEGQALWICEFCGNSNFIDEMQPDELPSKDTLDYVVEPVRDFEKKIICSYSIRMLCAGTKRGPRHAERVSSCVRG
jgi:hypothetical protein